MLTTPPQTPPGGFTNGLSKIKAQWLNYVSNNLEFALDAVGGGYYQLVGDDIRISSDTMQVKINAPAVSDPIALLGYVTIGLSDDSNYVTGVGGLTVSVPATFTAGITYSGAITYSSTVTFNGAVTFGSGGDITLNSGCALTASSGSSIIASSGSTLTVSTKLTLSGNGAGIRKRWGDVNDSDVTIHTTADVYLCQGATGTRDITLAVTTAPVPEDGEEISLVVSGMLAGSYDVYYEGSASALVEDLGIATIDSMASFVYRASTSRWYLLTVVNGTVGSNAA